MNNATLSKLNTLKEAGEDFEWYPTTDEMIHAVWSAAGREFQSMLDIGAGDGRVLEKLNQLAFEYVNREHADREYDKDYEGFKRYAIELSPIHIENMPPNISIVGTDFKYQTLIDKKVDMVFCNPPYTEFEEWATKIIKQANTQTIFLILPDRWKVSKLIRQAIKLRGATDRVIWSGDFSNADRAARARVDIIKISLSCETYTHSRSSKCDPFGVWFDEYFPGFDKSTPIDEDEDDETEEEEKKNPMKEIMPGSNLIEHLSTLYMAEMAKLFGNYETLSTLDADLLHELGVEVSDIKDGLKLKIDGLKTKYWKELFDNLDKITERLTSGSRSALLSKLNESCNIDFTVDNAYAVVIWVIKNANKYLNDQLVEMFKTLSEPEHIKNYKSNQRVWGRDEWRYQRKKEGHSHYQLDYRIVSPQGTAIKNDTYGWGFENGLSKDCHSFINDIFTVSRNLGFRVDPWNHSFSRHWESNQLEEFKCVDDALTREDKDHVRVLVAIRAFKNGNIHLRFDQKFIKTLNVEASRLLGWIKTPAEAVEEMGLDYDFVAARFNSNMLIGAVEGQKLLTA